MNCWINNTSAELRRLYLCLEEDIKKTKDQSDIDVGDEDDVDYERAVDQLEHDIRWEPTFNPDDGSM